MKSPPWKFRLVGVGGAVVYVTTPVGVYNGVADSGDSRVEEVRPLANRDPDIGAPSERLMMEKVPPK